MVLVTNMSSFSIGKISARSCSKAYGSLKIGELHDGTPINMKIIIINGLKDDPVLLVTAGISGTGISSIEAARRVASKISSNELKGVLVVVPIVNEPAFLMKERFSILENSAAPIDLFATFPGNAEGYLTERIASILSEEIISKADYYVDLHNAAPGGRYEPFVVVYPGLTNPNSHAKALEFARSFGTKFITDAGSPGDKIPQKLMGRPQVLAGSKGIQSFMSQCGEEHVFEELDIEHQVRGVTNAMKYLGMVDGTPTIPKVQLLTSSSKDVKSNSGGFLDLKVKLGEKVKKGQIMGEVTNLFYESIEHIEVPVDGYVTRITTTPTICSGDRLGQITVAQPISE